MKYHISLYRDNAGKYHIACDYPILPSSVYVSMYACMCACMYVSMYVCMYTQSPLNQAPWDPRVSVSQKCQLQGKFVVFSNIIQ